MKIVIFSFILLFSASHSCFSQEKVAAGTEQHSISKVKYKKHTLEIDTLWVSQNDTTVFKQEEIFIHRPCSKPQLVKQYQLLNPIEGAYYFIYNDEKQLIKAGKYTIEQRYEGQQNKQGNFYDSKNYNYKNNGKLAFIHYQEDGRNLKTEYFDSKKRLKSIRYLNKKSGEISKIENYKKGLLQETRTIKAIP
ncbi:hypothetical protein [Flavobacterium sp. PL002]|uniref:hypothetical protein n=1 Tax=Flavobacterium sp. PL002 TaxID=1897058 RepID=UPI001787FE62|nr:hypothetical protein [Flavobacterium sp. PL002]MBE0392215.1 hypothetical protein [Flavobacterium sp. PL002]